MANKRSPRTPIRAPRYPYRANPLFPHEQRGEIGEKILDSVSANWFPKIYAINGPYGPVDCRDGATVDVDQEDHEVAITMVGPMRPPRT